MDNPVFFENGMEAGLGTILKLHAFRFGKLRDGIEQGGEHARVAGGERLVLSAGGEFVVSLEGHRGIPVDDVRCVSVSMGGIGIPFRAEPIVHQIPVADVFQQIAFLENGRFRQFRSDTPCLIKLIPFSAGLRATGACHGQAFND